MNKMCVGKPGEWYAQDWMRLDGQFHMVEIHVEPHRTRHWVDGEARWKWMLKHPLLFVRLLGWTQDFVTRARTMIAAAAKAP